jgi:hypothetical protein
MFMYLGGMIFVDVRDQEQFEQLTVSAVSHLCAYPLSLSLPCSRVSVWKLML